VFAVGMACTKVPSVINADIGLVVDGMKVQYRYMKGGFSVKQARDMGMKNIREREQPLQENRLETPPRRMSFNLFGESLFIIHSLLSPIPSLLLCQSVGGLVDQPMRN
jgi:hypothetical protein